MLDPPLHITVVSPAHCTQHSESSKEKGVPLSALTRFMPQGPWQQVGTLPGWRRRASWSCAVPPEGPGPSLLEPLGPSPAQAGDGVECGCSPSSLPSLSLCWHGVSAAALPLSIWGRVAGLRRGGGRSLSSRGPRSAAPCTHVCLRGAVLIPAPPLSFLGAPRREGEG